MSIEYEWKKHIAKFSASTDLYYVVKAEFVAMRLAGIAGMNVAAVKLVQALDRDVLLVERFDRERSAEGWKRRAMVSALTLFGLHRESARGLDADRRVKPLFLKVGVGSRFQADSQLWLFFYEIWLATSDWLGGGEHPESRD